jgi:hypothetical protein
MVIAAANPDATKGVRLRHAQRIELDRSCGVAGEHSRIVRAALLEAIQLPEAEAHAHTGRDGGKREQ